MAPNSKMFNTQKKHIYLSFHIYTKSQISRLHSTGDIQHIVNIYLVFHEYSTFIDLKKKEFYQKLFDLAKKYEI